MRVEASNLCAAPHRACIAKHANKWTRRREPSHRYNQHAKHIPTHMRTFQTRKQLALTARYASSVFTTGAYSFQRVLIVISPSSLQCTNKRTSKSVSSIKIYKNGHTGWQQSEPHRHTCSPHQSFNLFCAMVSGNQHTCDARTYTHIRTHNSFCAMVTGNRHSCNTQTYIHSYAHTHIHSYARIHTPVQCQQGLEHLPVFALRPPPLLLDAFLLLLLFALQLLYVLLEAMTKEAAVTQLDTLALKLKKF